MATIYRFEDLEFWKAAKDVLVMIYNISSKEQLKKESSFQDQLKRAGLSVSNNIAEGFERKSTKERIRYLEIALGSASEVKSMLHVGLALGFFNQSEFESTFALCEKCQKLIKG